MRKTGCWPDPPHDKPRPYLARLVGAAAPPPPAKSWDALRPPIWDQGSTARCVGFAYKRALMMAARANGIALEEPSATGLYALGQAIQYANPRAVAYPDEGTHCMGVALGVRLDGIPREADWATDDRSLVGRVLPPDVLLSADGAQFECDQAIPFLMDHYDPSERARHRRLRREYLERALASGHFPVLVLDATDDFMRARGPGVLGAPTGVSHGLHAVTAVGYGPEGVRIDNSYGAASWGDGGSVWLSWSRVCSPAVPQVRIVRPPPSPPRQAAA